MREGTLGLLDRLARHMLWADERVGTSLEAAPAPARAVELYAHLIATEALWLDRVEGTAPGPVWPKLEGSGSGPVEESRAAVSGRYLDFLQHLTIDDLDRKIEYRNSAGREFTTPLLDILVHVFMHGSYHRGQISMILRDEGGEPAATDYVAFVRGAPAATRVDDARRWRP